MPLDTVGGDLPLPLGGGGGAVGVPPSDLDVMVEQLPFWLAISTDNPYARETAQFQRDQVDQAPEAGEQSLAGWWTRSQMSFHMGAGLDYLDTTQRPDPNDRLRYKTSYNVDPWTPGEVTRLNATQISHPHTEQSWLAPLDNGGLLSVRPSKIEKWNGTAWSELNYGSAFPIRAFATDGVNYYVANIDGVFTGPLTGATTGTKLFELPDTDVPMCLGWVKQRLMLGHGNKAYSLDTTGPALPTPRMTHPVTSWQWTSFADSPSGIVGCGYSGLQSGAYKFELTTLSDAPVLGPGLAFLSMPAGERITSSLFYVGSMLILGTSRGVRVCQYNSLYGTLSMGPLIVQATTTPVTALGGYDRYVFAGATLNGTPTCLRIDLSAPLDDAGHYAWAPDLPVPGAVTSFAFRDDGRKWLGVQGFGLVEELAAPDAATPAWIETARIRFGTVEDKHFAYASVRGCYNADLPITVSTAGPADGMDLPTWTAVHTARASTERFQLRVPRAEYISLRFSLDAAQSCISSYQVQALPAAKRQRLVALPVAIADYQLTRSGIEVGYDGWALERLRAVEALEEAGAEITVSAPALFPEAVRGVIEKLSYTQPHDPGDRGTGTGGVLQILFRTTT